jgi:hypothetical protein
MKYLKTYENYNYELLIERFDYQSILESNKNSLYKTVHNKTVSKLALNLYFVGTFQMGVTILYPIVEALVKNTNIPQIITPEHIVLMTIFSISQILYVANDDVKKIREELEKDNLLQVVDKVKKSLMSIFKIFKFVSRSFGKIVDVFTDMLAYLALGAPIYMAVLEIISKEGLNLETLPQKVMILGGGAALFAFKSLIETIVALVKNKLMKNLYGTSKVEL